MCAECLEEKHEGVIYGLHLGDYDFRYIGKSINHKRRFQSHLYSAKAGAGFAVQSWIRKHGAENVQMTIIETFDEGTIGLIDEREIFHIAQARAYYGANLNLTDGGEGATNPSAENRAARSAAMAGNQIFLGRTHTEETKTKMSASHKGNTSSRGVKRSDEFKAKISAAAGPRNHKQWHVNRNLVNPDCKFCTNANESQQHGIIVEVTSN